MQKKQHNLKFVEYDTNKHKEEINAWQSEINNKVYGYDRFVKYGLLELGCLQDILDCYAPIPTSQELVKTYLVFSEEKCVGVVVLDWCSYETSKNNSLNVFHLLVRPSEMRHGYGSAILERIKKDGKSLIDREYSDINLSIDKTNIPCQEMSEKCGFNCEGQAGSYYLYSFKENDNALERE